MSIRLEAQHPEDTFEVVSAADCATAQPGPVGETPEGEQDTCLCSELEENGDGAAADFLVSCYKGDLVMVRELLEYGVSPDAVSTYCQSTAIHLAVQGGYSDVITVLVEAGANVNMYNEEGRCPIHEAAIQGRPHIASLLVQSGADVNAHTVELGETALHLAIQWREKRVLQVLLQHNADWSVVDKMGRTPLHWAARFANLAATRVLVQYGSSASLRDKTGESPLYVAASQHHLSVLMAMLKASSQNLSSTSLSCKLCMRSISAALLRDHLQVCSAHDLPSAGEQPDIGTLLSQHRATLCKTKSSVLCRIQVRRSHAWEDALAFYKQQWSAADLAREPSVKFVGEPGVDAGGPRRDFFRILASVASTEASLLLEGRPGRLLPRHNVQALESGLFAALGCLVGHSIIHGGPGLPVFSKAVFDFLCLESGASSSAGVQLQLALEDVTDERLHDVVTKLSCADEEEFVTLLNEDESVKSQLFVSGYCRPLSKCTATRDAASILHCLLYHEIILRRKAELDQFRLGLGHLGLVDIIRRFPLLMAPFFVENAMPSGLSVDDVVGLLQPVYPKTDMRSAAGKARLATCHQVYRCFLKFLQRCYDEKDFGVSLGAVLVFLTGSDVIPPGGFGQPINIFFGEYQGKEDGDQAADGNLLYRLPCVSTCSLTLTLFLPKSAGAASLDEAMLVRTLWTAITESSESYGRA